MLVSLRKDYDPGQGWRTTYVYEGDSLSIYGLTANLRSDQKASIDDSDKPLFRLTVQSPDAGSASVANDFVWSVELVGSEVQPSIYAHPRTQALSDGVIAAIKVAVKEVEDSSISEAVAKVASGTTAVRAAATTAGTSAADAAEVLALVLRDITSYTDSQYVLKRTQTISTRSQLILNYENINRIHSTALVNAVEIIPYTVLVAIVQIVAPAEMSGFAWGWLKKTPSINQVANGKFTASQEYWLGQWSTYLYGALLVP